MGSSIASQVVHPCGGFEDSISPSRGARHVGILPLSLYWLRNHTREDLYRRGRLDYMIKPFRGPLQAYRNQLTGAVVALALEGTAFDAEGFIAGAEQQAAWRATRADAVDRIRGSVISPLGHGVKTQVAPARNEWKLVLSPGYPILDTRIPSGGGMTRERCRESMQQALDFFPRYFPNAPFAGFAATAGSFSVCWLLPTCWSTSTVCVPPFWPLT
jgi:GNAT domain-containint protein